MSKKIVTKKITVFVLALNIPHDACMINTKHLLIISLIFYCCNACNNNAAEDISTDTVVIAKGETVFNQNCSGCHQIQGSGGLVGPQLDGIGNWGHKALTQKILDPNRNITEAFRTYNITLKNEKTLTGLYRRTEGETIVFADMTGQEFSVAKGDMKEYRASKYTLMPDQFRNIIPEKDFYALLDYLLGVK